MSTTVSIELTDDQVAKLRRGGWAKGPNRIAGELLELVADALPPEPVRVTVDLPPGLVDKIRRNVIHVPPEASVDLWRHVERALRQAQETGVPVA